MIEITGRIKNAVDCGCYEIEAVPAADPRERPHDCVCDDAQIGRTSQEATPRVRVNAERAFAIRVENAQLAKWFAGKNRWFTFRIYLNGELKLATATPYAWSARRKLNRPIEIDLCLPIMPPHHGKVCGKITDCRGNPLAGMKVLVYDVDLYDAIQLRQRRPSVNNREGKQEPPLKIGTLLAETLTNECGEYCVCYTYESYRAGEIGSADIRVIVGPAQGRFRELQSSDIQFNAAKELTVDLAVPGSELDGAGEFLEYHSQLARLGCLTPVQRKNLTDAQLDFISSEARIPLDHLIQLRQAYENDAEFVQPLQALPSHVIPQILYGLLRMGVTGPFPSWAGAYADWEGNNLRPGRKLGKLLAEAIDGCIIDRGLGVLGRRADTAAAGQAIWFFAFTHALTTPLLPNRSSWRELFAVVFPQPADAGILVIFGLAWLRFGIGDAMWKQLNPLLTAYQTSMLQQLVQRAEISGFFAPAVALFQGDEPGLLVAVESDANWRGYFNTASVTPQPRGIAFQDYSAEVRERARVVFGGRVVKNWVNAVRPVDFPALTLSNTDAHDSAERLSRLTTSVAFAKRLAAAGFTSARDIAGLRWQDFIARLSEPEGSVQALYTYTKARETRAIVTALTLQLARSLNAPFDSASVPFLVSPDFTGTTLNGIADTIFGSGSACNCEGRQSVFSPAAYLHALRRFLGNIGSAASGLDGRALLDARRPEMRSLQLSYLNSNTVMPTIDLNNEVLEDFVASTLNPPVPPLTNRQTTLVAAELELKFEYENAAVYERFVEDTALIRPWRFPFNLNHAKRRIFLDSITLAREQIVTLSTLVPTAHDLAEAVLDVNEGQRACIETSSPTASAYDATRLELRNPSTVMDRAQLIFEELYGMTRLSAIYSGAPPHFYPAVDGSSPTSCDPSAYQLNDADYPGMNPGALRPPISDPQADHIHRFSRLWRALPWPMHLLDWAIGEFVKRGQPMFPLEWLGMAELIRRRLRLKPHEVIAFWGDLSTQRWDMPFVKSKPVASPWEQVFRVSPANLALDMLAEIARSAGISQQFATLLLGSGTFDRAMASIFYRYGRLSKAVGSVHAEDIKTYETLSETKVFASPEDTWRALCEWELIHRSGAQLSVALSLYLKQTDPGTPLERREMLVALQQLNHDARVPQGPFETVLARFVPEATVPVVVAKLAGYAIATSPEANADLDQALAWVLSLPELLASPLSALTGATEAAKDAKRKDQILSELSRRMWDRGIATVLCKASGLDTATARILSNVVKTSTSSSALPPPTIITRLKALVGDGGAWTGWPTGIAPEPTAQALFLDEGVLTVSAAAVTSGFDVMLTASLLVAVPGDYQLRVRAVYDTSNGTVSVDGASLALGEAKPIEPGFTIKERDSVTQTVSFHVAATTACTLRLELIDPSGNAQPLPGNRLYSDSTTSSSVVAGAMEGLELIALCGKLAAQWTFGAAELAALVRLHEGNASFPAFPPTSGTVAQRPLRADDPDGFKAWLDYARLVAAVKMTKGEGRQLLFEAALLAQSGSATDDAIWSTVAQALEIDKNCVTDAALQLNISMSDFGDGRYWFKLFDLSRALQEHGVSAKTFAGWGKTFRGGLSTYPDSGNMVASLEAAVRTKLSKSRSGSDTLRGAINCVRAVKRDVLCDYLMANPPTNPQATPTGGLEWRTRKDISDYLLTDIEMESCSQTSRIRFAIAAPQRLVSQTLAQKEPLRLTAEQESEWRSICQYRLWEVSQRILLHSENWIRFGRHLHKTPEFEVLERSLLQGNITEEQATEALTHYVEQLHVVGHLEIVGTCCQQEMDATGAVSLDVFHVIGRTPAEPRTYFHRTRIDGAYWTPWRKIEIDIDCDQIVPVVHNRQLHLYWLVEESKVQDKPNIQKDDRQLSLEDTYKVLRLAWSVLTSKGWRAKMVSKPFLSTRFGHHAANAFVDLGWANPYAELHMWNQAVQDTGTYQLRPTLHDEGDPVIEVYARLQSVTTQKVDRALLDWVYQMRDVLNRAVAGLGTNWFDPLAVDASVVAMSLLNGIRSTANLQLGIASPTVPTVSQTDSATASTSDLQLIGSFRLTPDNLVEVRSRSAQFQTPPQYLTAVERMKIAPRIPSAVSRNGAFEFDDGSVELDAGGGYRTVLATAGTPVRVIVTRQEGNPSQHDPVFCRIKNRAFFAFKVPPALPPVTLQIEEKPSYRITNAFQTVPREHVDRAASVGYLVSASLVKRVAHGSALAMSVASSYVNRTIGNLSVPWRFALAHHPQSIELLRATKAGLDHLYKRETQNDSRAATGSLSIPFDFDSDYDAVPPWVDMAHLPIDELEFLPDQAYSGHNWELLYHSAMLMGQQAMKIGLYDDARQWIARVFNPRDPAVRDPASGLLQHPENYWVFKPFVNFVAGGGLSDFANLNPNGSGDPYQRSVFRALIKQWRANPYNPHAVAAFRPQAYQMAAIFLAVENLIAWGDALFSASSAELVEEAARRYEEAEHIIGRPPLSTGAIRCDTPALNVSELESGVGLADKALGSVEIENALSLGDGPSPQVEDAFLPDLAIGYFCLPPNPKIKELRDKIQDRLFKVHHCLDLLGNPRQLPLYDPPISPELLADAAMAGLNVSQAVMNAYTPRPHYRCRTLLGLTKGLGQHVIALGAGLLASMEKKDAESLNLLKATHESKLLERATTVRKLQVEDAEASIKALDATLRMVEHRHEFYSSREFMNAEETAQIVLSIASTVFRIVSQALSTASSAISAGPDFIVGGAGFGGSPVALMKTGGGSLSRVPAGLSLAVSAVSEMLGTLSSVVGSVGSFRRRKEEWDFQAAGATLEAKQINAQRLGAQIRQTIAMRELENHQAQLEESREALEFVRTKQTSVRRYEWLEADIGASLFRAFQLFHSMALQTQRAMQDEIGTTQNFIGHSHWDGSRNGLQAGERLMQDLLEMESFYHHQNARPVVKTINVSLAQVNPIALAELRATGTCDFELNEAFWNKHAPALYFRRFASIAASVPAVVGQFNGVHGRLSIVRASYRVDPSLLGSTPEERRDAYPRQQGGEDPRFVDQFARPGDFIVLSTGVRDTGLGADEAKEDRCRPCENLGVDSSWHLEISQRDNAFDLATMADVILHVEYTARDGGAQLGEAARAALTTLSSTEGFLISLRHQYPGEWQAFKSSQPVEIDVERQLPSMGPIRDQRKFDNLNIAMLVRAKTQPATDSNVIVALTLPDDTLVTNGALEFNIAVAAPLDGATRCGLDTHSLIDSAAPSNASFEVLRSDKWILVYGSKSAIALEDLEDLIICANWSLAKEAT